MIGAPDKELFLAGGLDYIQEGLQIVVPPDIPSDMYPTVVTALPISGAGVTMGVGAERTAALAQ